MGLGNLGDTTKKVSAIADTAEQMYKKLTEVREQVEITQETVQDTGDRVQKLESEIVEQRALIEAIAQDLDVDVDAVTADAHITDAEMAAQSDDDPDDSPAEESIPDAEDRSDEETPKNGNT